MFLMDLIQSGVLNSAACRPRYQTSLSLPGILLPGYQLPPACELEKPHMEAASGLSRGGATPSSCALRHTSRTEEQQPGDVHSDAQRPELV